MHHKVIANVFSAINLVTMLITAMYGAWPTVLEYPGLSQNSYANFWKISWHPNEQINSLNSLNLDDLTDNNIIQNRHFNFLT